MSVHDVRDTKISNLVRAHPVNVLRAKTICDKYGSVINWNFSGLENSVFGIDAGKGIGWKRE